MNKIQIKKMIASQIKVIGQAQEDMAISRWERAKAFYEIHGMIVWEKSPYKSFKQFVAIEFLDIAPGSAYLWVLHYGQMIKLYTWAQIQVMSKSISFSRAVRAQQSWGTKNKTSLVKFIKFAKTVKNHDYGKKPTVSNPNRITLSLPVLYVDKFESTLVPYGYSIPKDSTATKYGISEALVKYLDSI